MVSQTNALTSPAHGASAPQSLPRLYAPAVALIGLLLVLPLFVAHHLPLLDAAGHESRLIALVDITGRYVAPSSAPGSPFYDASSLFLPNVAFDLIGTVLALLTDPETAGRLFFGATLWLTFGGVLVLNRVVTGRTSLLPAASGLFLYNLITILGFFSYAFGVALVPWGLAARWRLDAGRPGLRWSAGAAIGCILLFCHVSAFGIFAVMSGGMALDAALQRRIRLGGLLFRWSETLPPIALFLAMSTSGGSQRLRWDHPFLQVKLFNLVKSVTAGTITGDIAFLVGAGALAGIVLFAARTRIARSFLPGLAGLILLYFILPFGLSSGSYVDIRLPFAIVLMVLGGLSVEIRRRWLAAALAIAVALALAVKQGALAALWHSFDPELDRIALNFTGLPKGAILFQIECQPAASDVAGVYRERQPSLSHVAAMAAFDDSVFVPSTWVIAGQQPVRVKAEYMPYYALQDSFGDSLCAEADDRQALERIRALGKADSPPLYLFLIRPPRAGMLDDQVRRLWNTANTELYVVTAP